MGRKRKKVIGQPLPGRGCFDDLGDVVAVPLSGSYWGYLRRCRDAAAFILSSLSKDRILPLDAVKGSATIGCECFIEPWDQPTWVYLGNWPFQSAEEAWPPPRYHIDLLDPAIIWIHHLGALRRAAGPEEVKGLREDQGLSFPGHLAEAIRVAHRLPPEREAIAKIAPYDDAWEGFRDREEEQRFAPFFLRHRFGEYFLMFAEWDWLWDRYGADPIAGCCLNGHGVQALIQAARLSHGLPMKKHGIGYHSESEFCLIEFRSHQEATLTAELAQAMITDAGTLKAMTAYVKDHGLDYWTRANDLRRYARAAVKHRAMWQAVSERPSPGQMPP